MRNVQGLPKWKVALMIGCAASIVGIACAVAALVFGLALADRNHKLASTARAETALAAARTETARPTETPKPKTTAPTGTAVAVPTLTPSLTPQPTAPATFTPVPPTATPTPSPTSTARPTSTRRPATATPAPTAPPASPTAPLPPPAPPVLGEPTDFAGIWNLQTFTWTPSGALAADQYYVVHVRIFGDVRTEAHSLGIPIKESSLTVDVQLRARDHVWNHWIDGSLEHGHEAWWSVAIVRCPNGPSAQYEVLTETYLRSFTFMGFPHLTKKECGCNEHVCGECRCHEECCQVCCKRCGEP
jgi:hypothetical protein